MGLAPRAATATAALLLLLAAACLVKAAVGDVTVRVVHFNDIHARIEPANSFQGPCNDEQKAEGSCFGGWAKIATFVKEKKKDGELLVLDAGDEFVGTVWHSLFRGNATAMLMNEVGVQAFVLGNHEFDFGTETLGTFVDMLDTPVLGSNLDTSKDEFLDGKVVPSVVLDFEGVKVGVVGYITEDTVFISSPGKNVKFQNTRKQVQAAIDELTEDGVNIIIGLGHIGLRQDRELAESLSGMDIIIGGHSHTLLEGDEYPNVVTGADGKDVRIVQAFWASKFAGYFEATFNDDGELVDFVGEPVPLSDNSSDPTVFVKDDPGVSELIDGLRPEIMTFRNRPVGDTAVNLERFVDRNSTQRESKLGNMICDSMVWFMREATDVEEEEGGMQLCLTNAGGIRASIPKGQVTLEDVLTVLPFGNTLVVKGMTPADIYKMLEQGVRKAPNWAGEFPVVAGIMFSYCPDLPEGEKVTSVSVRTEDGEFVDIEREDTSQIFNLVTNNFLNNGGDGYTIFAEVEDVFPLGPPMDDAMKEYITAFSPIDPKIEGRVAIQCGN